jgi:hypothetical protein
MSPDNDIRGGKPTIFSDVYTALLALAVGVVLSTAVLMVIKCAGQYGTIFSIAKP